MSRFRYAVLALAGLLTLGACQDGVDPTGPQRPASRDYELPDGQIIAIGNEHSLMFSSGVAGHSAMCTTRWVDIGGLAYPNLAAPCSVMVYHRSDALDGSEWTGGEYHDDGFDT